MSTTKSMLMQTQHYLYAYVQGSMLDISLFAANACYLYPGCSTNVQMQHKCSKATQMLDCQSNAITNVNDNSVTQQKQKYNFNKVFRPFALYSKVIIKLRYVLQLKRGLSETLSRETLAMKMVFL